MNARVLAVDGGQSTIRLRHSDGSAAEERGISWGGNDTTGEVAGAIGAAFRVAGSPATDVAMLGLTTVPAASDELDRLAQAVAAATGAARVLIADDGITTHAGALAGGWGIALSVGTGVACVGLQPADAAPHAESNGPVFVDGHGYLLGDDGGGFWIGRAGVRAALRAVERRGPATTLVDVVTEAFGSIDDLHIRLHADRRAVDTIARFAPEVVRAADAGDEVAGSILHEAAAELAATLLACRTSIGSHPNTPTALVGRLAPLLGVRLSAALATSGDAVDLRPPAGTPLDGALRIGYDPRAYGRAIHHWSKD